MKKYITLILSFTVLTNCKAQTPIFNISKPAGIYSIKGAYYKDTNNELDAFVGNYLYSSGNTSLKIILQKKIMSSMNGYYYEDLIIGEYQYIRDGIEKTNTLDKLALNYSDQSNHNISGHLIMTGPQLGCEDCGSNEKRLRVGLKDDMSDNVADMVVRLITVNGQAAIEVWFGWIGPIAHPEGTPMPKPAGLRAGTYTLIKQ